MLVSGHCQTLFSPVLSVKTGSSRRRVRGGMSRYPGLCVPFRNTRPAGGTSLPSCPSAVCQRMRPAEDQNVTATHHSNPRGRHARAHFGYLRVFFRQRATPREKSPRRGAKKKRSIAAGRGASRVLVAEADRRRIFLRKRKIDLLPGPTSGGGGGGAGRVLQRPA